MKYERRGRLPFGPYLSVGQSTWTSASLTSLLPRGQQGRTSGHTRACRALPWAHVALSSLIIECKLYNLRVQAMRITRCFDQTARLWATVSSVAALQTKRRCALCLAVISQLRSFCMRLDARFRHFCNPNFSQRDVVSYSSRAFLASPHCGHLCPTLATFRNPHHYPWTCEARATAACPQQQPFEGAFRRRGHPATGCSKENTCASYSKRATGGDSSCSTLMNAGSEVLHTTKVGAFPQQCPSASLPVRIRREPMRNITGTAAVKESARAWKQRLKENDGEELDRPILLNDEAGRETLLMSRAAIQRLQTLCARRRSQESIEKKADNSTSFRVEGRAEGTTHRTRPQPVVGLQVRVTSGGCSGYQYSFGLLTSAEVQKLWGNEEYSVFWPPSPVSSPQTPTSTESGPTRSTSVVQRAVPPSGTEGPAFSCDTTARTLPATTESAGIGKQEKEKEDILQGRSGNKNVRRTSGWCVLVDRCSLPLFGTNSVIDFEDTLAASEFIVQQNDRAENICSCGRSFALKDEF